MTCQLGVAADLRCPSATPLHWSRAAGVSRFRVVLLYFISVTSPIIGLPFVGDLFNYTNYKLRGPADRAGQGQVVITYCRVLASGIRRSAVDWWAWR